ncbi:MAG: hypothetical protein PHT40_02585 [Patescibacteria group bacterium]|nr:hypothetical protein [Patescibacteria group bacterium]
MGNHFVVLKSNLLGSLEDPLYRQIMGCTFSEKELRAWAKESFAVPNGVSFRKIARVIAKSGWVLTKIIPTKT